MWIKICANTNLADAQLAVDLGADAVGFVFAPSARQVTLEQVAAIVPHLPPHVETIAVVHSHDAAEIAELARRTGVTGVQLHGGLDLPLIRALRTASPGRLRLIQTLHWSLDEPDSAQRLSMQLDELAAESNAGHSSDPTGQTLDRVLIDAKVGAATGGTGRSFDWHAARGIFAAHNRLKLIVAGGLRPGNVAEAIQALEPWGVDVASGVEASPGRKDPVKLKAFLENARACLSQAATQSASQSA
jgi:phosphoribosylanthranilate isomerase